MGISGMRAVASHTHPEYALCITVDIAHEYNLPKGLGSQMTTCHGGYTYLTIWQEEKSGMNRKTKAWQQISISTLRIKKAMTG